MAYKAQYTIMAGRRSIRPGTVLTEAQVKSYKFSKEQLAQLVANGALTEVEDPKPKPKTKAKAKAKAKATVKPEDNQAPNGSNS
jgi:hypothetical protein